MVECIELQCIEPWTKHVKKASGFCSTKVDLGTTSLQHLKINFVEKHSLGSNIVIVLTQEFKD